MVPTTWSLQLPYARIQIKGIAKLAFEESLGQQSIKYSRKILNKGLKIWLSSKVKTKECT